MSTFSFKKFISALFLIAVFPAFVIAQSKTFTNPLLPSGADPWCIKVGGYYYYTNSMQNSLVLWKTKNIV